MKKRTALPWLVIAAAISVSPAAYGGTIDTFNFSEPNVYEIGGSGQPFEFAGSFTGAVEASGLIELADLSAFNVQLADSNGNPIPPVRSISVPPTLWGRSALFCSQARRIFPHPLPTSPWPRA